MKTKPKTHPLILALLSLSTFAHAQGNIIGYQGRLNDGGLPATGLYDFTFDVFDVELDGAALAATVVLDAVPVTNGVFNVPLDFGPNIFTGMARWLEISARANGVGDPIVLTPRTPLRPTPYSIFAGTAGGVAHGAVTPDQLNTGGMTPGARSVLVLGWSELFLERRRHRRGWHVFTQWNQRLLQWRQCRDWHALATVQADGLRRRIRH